MPKHRVVSSGGDAAAFRAVTVPADPGEITLSSPEWSRYRTEFPVTREYAYFQHPAVTALPGRARTAIQEFCDDIIENGCLNEPGWSRRRERIRDRAASLLGTRPDRVGFVHSTSYGLSLIAESIPWNREDVVLVPEGEFPANVYPWLNQGRKGVEVRRIPLRDGGIYAESIREALDSNTRVLALSSTQFHNGFRADLETIGQICRDRGVGLVVDGIQSIGWDTLRMDDLPVDAIVADAHKWMCGPEGVGLCYMEESFQRQLEWAMVGWNSVTRAFEFDRIQFELKPGASVIEEGSPNNLGLHGLGASLDLLLEVGLPAIRSRALELRERADQALAKRGFVLPHRNWDTVHRSPILTAHHPRLDPETIRDHCRDHNVQISVRGGRIRAGFHFYNDESDLEKWIDALDRLL